MIVACPDLRFSVRALDFGRGFYTTTDERQAANFAKTEKSLGLLCFTGSMEVAA